MGEEHLHMLFQVLKLKNISFHFPVVEATSYSYYPVLEHDYLNCVIQSIIEQKKKKRIILFARFQRDFITSNPY